MPKATHNPRPFALESLELRQLLSGTPWNPWAVQIGQDAAVANYPYLDGSGESVVVLDTGAYWQHPSFTGGSGQWGKIVYWHDYFGTSTTPVDSVGHGTGNAALIAGNNFTYAGQQYQGIAPGANLIVLRTAGKSTPWSTEGQDIINALNWVIANVSTYHIVGVNMSTGQGKFTSTALAGDQYAAIDGQLAQQFATLAGDGVFLSAAAGNDGATKPNTDEYPAADPNVYAISSVNVNDAVSSFSSRGPMTDLYAPGENLTMAYYVPSSPGTYYIQGANGTSFSTPQVTAAAVLLRQIDPSFTPDQIIQILKTSGTPVTDATTGSTFPRLNLNAAIALAFQQADDLNNHSLATATALNWSGTSASLGNLTSLLHVADYYKLTLNAGADVSFGLAVNGSNPGLGYDLLDANGSLVTNLGASGKSVVLSAGTYYLRVTGGSATLQGTYALSLSQTSDDGLNNHSAATAAPIDISSGSGSRSNLTLLANVDDYYSFTLNSTSDVTALLSTASTYPTVELLNAFGAHVADIGAGGLTSRLTPGNYLIRVASPSTIPNYSVSVSATPVVQPGANATTAKIAYDASGVLHMAWFDGSTNNLKYASRATDGTWSNVTTVDAGQYCGQWVSIAIDPSGHPGIAYYDGYYADLKYAHFDGSTWSTQTIDSLRVVGQYPSLAYSSTGAAVIAYYMVTYGDLKLASQNGDGTWAVATIDSAGTVGRSASLAYDAASGQWGIGYEDLTHGWEKYATLKRGKWAASVVDATTVAAGGSISLAFDKNHLPAMSYYDGYIGGIKFARFNGAAWSTALLARKKQGLFTNLFFDASNDPEVLYYNQGAGGVFADSYANGSWTISSLATGGYGTFAARDPIGGNLTVSWIANNAVDILDM